MVFFMCHAHLSDDSPAVLFVGASQIQIRVCPGPGEETKPYYTH